jgi:peptide/nickel transport system permease protein
MAIGSRAPSGLDEAAGYQQRRRAAIGWRQFVDSPTRLVATVVLGVLAAGALLAPLVAPHDPLAIEVQSRLLGPSWRHPLGTDELGRDLLSNILYASRISLVVGGAATLLSAIVAVPLGLLAGLRGGLVGVAIMRLTDGLLAIPNLMLALAIVASLGTSTTTLLVAIAITLMPATIRLLRAETLVEQGKDYVLAARALGATQGRIMFRHVLPNAASTILVQVTLGMTIAILIEAFMSYVGLGVQPPRSSLGTLLASGYGFVGLSAWYVTFPGLVIFALVWTFNILGDGLRDALDPRLRGATAR